ncbi:MAG: DUF2079 domain-containing protein [Solirubrobacteraceae bacterium]
MSVLSQRTGTRASRWSVDRLWTREPMLFVVVGATAILDSVASIMRHIHFGSGLDLAIFDQAVWHYSRFEAPFSSIKAENLLGDHFHPILALLAPLYWLWSDPRMLLIAQSVLVAASIIPVFLFAQTRLGRTGAYLLAGAYAVYWGIQVGVLYDFHEVAFAPLLIALTILLADRRRWGWFWLVIVLLLGVKEDLSIFVVFVGIYLLTRREIRHGLALIVVGIAWYELATRVFIPHFAGGTHYVYWTYGQLGKNPLDALGAVIRAPWRLFTIGFSPAPKAHTILALLAPFLFLSVGSRLFILALPLFAERFLSTNANFWFTHYDYSLAISPVLAMAAAAGLGNLVRVLPGRRGRIVVIAGAAAMLVTSVAVSKLGTSDSAINSLTDSSFYHRPAFAAGASHALEHVSSSAALETNDLVLPHASERLRIDQLDPKTVGLDDYLMINVTHPTCCGATGNGSYDVLGKVLNNELPRVTPIYYADGWLVAKRPQNGQAPANGALVPMPANDALTVNHAATSWRAGLVDEFTHFFACYHRWQLQGQSASGCFAGAVAPLRRRQRALSTAIHAVLPALEHPCAELATGALVATHQLTLDLRLLTPAAASASRTALSAAATVVQNDAIDLDLSGQLDRFTILCSPR